VLLGGKNPGRLRFGIEREAVDEPVDAGCRESAGAARDELLPR
jgi:hypothetical protein